jgi:hypothetical protein
MCINREKNIEINKRYAGKNIEINRRHARKNIEINP